MKYEHVRNRIHVRLKIYSYGWTAKGHIRRISLQKVSKKIFRFAVLEAQHRTSNTEVGGFKEAK